MNTIEGVHLFCFAYDSLDARMRKTLIKNMKGKVIEILSNDENDFAYLALVKILQATDDTTLVKKSLLGVRRVEELLIK